METKWTLPFSAGIVAYDRDECTVTIAFDCEADVLAATKALPHRNRVKLCDDTALTGIADPSAIPELVEALQEAVDQYGKPGGPWNVLSDPGGWLARARAALAKVKGDGA